MRILPEQAVSEEHVGKRAVSDGAASLRHELQLAVRQTDAMCEDTLLDGRRPVSQTPSARPPCQTDNVSRSIR